MTKRVLRELLALAAVLLPGLIGTVVVAKTLSTYWGRDVTAGGIVAAIGVALLLGMAELVQRQLRAARLDAEVSALPARPRPEDATLERTSPLLGSLLRARLENLPMPSVGMGAGESIAPFLTGLVVMLGLLGTLLGLFQTVHGAGHALTSASDVEALRRSLGAPIAGLTRSFGCSAAGISASAMLGLSLALVRRRESRLLRAIYAYAAGPLHAQSPLRRQTRALEQLVSQGNSLPQAASALDGVSQKLHELSQHVVELQQSALKDQQRAWSELLDSLREQLARAAADSGQQLLDKLGPLMEQLSQMSAHALGTQADAFAAAAQRLQSELAEDAASRRNETGEVLRSLRAQLDEAERARAAAHAAELEKLSSLATHSLSEAERRETQLSERWLDQLSRLDSQLEGARSSEAERLRRLDEQLALLRERDDSRLRELDGLTGRVGGELTRLAEALGAQIEQRGHEERERAAQTLHAALQLTAAGDALQEHAQKQQAIFEQSAEQQKATLEKLVEHLPVLFERAAQSSQQAAQAALTQLSELTERRLTQVSEHLTADVDARAQAERTLVEHAERAFDAVQRRSGELSGLLARTEQLLPQLADAAHAGAQQTLARISEQAQLQAERFAELETALTQLRHEQVQELAAQLCRHADEQEHKLSQAVHSVQEAAAVWQASSAEMQAVAKLFASSIERQREASDAWIESLGEVEGAVERAGQHAARDALTDQLAATQEVFARQLQFQRELFEQLRALRATASRVTHGEADVAV